MPSTFSHSLEDEIEALRDLGDLSKVTLQVSAKLEQVPELAPCPLVPLLFLGSGPEIVLPPGHCAALLPGHHTVCTTLQFRFAKCILVQGVYCVEANKKLNTWNFWAWISLAELLDYCRNGSVFILKPCTDTCLFLICNHTFGAGVGT